MTRERQTTLLNGAVRTIRPNAHVVHVMTRYLRGGSERRLHDMVRALPDATHELIVGADSLPDQARREVPLTAVTVVPTLVRAPSPARDASALASIWRILRAARPDLVVTHQSKAGALGRIAARRGHVPTVVSLSMANFGPGYPPLQGTLFRSLERRLHRSTSAYAVVGNDLAGRFERIGVPQRKLHVVRSGVRLPMGSYAGRRQELRDRLGVPRSRKVLAYLGSLDARKNVLDLVPLLQDLLDDGPARPFLAIAGEGPLDVHLERSIRSAGLVGDAALLGFLEDPLSLIAAADVVVLLSSAEGVSQVLIQAAALDTPFVAYHVDGVGELRDLGARGREVLLGDRRAAATAVREVLSWDPGEGRPSIDLAEWSPETIRASYRALFVEALAGAQAP